WVFCKVKNQKRIVLRIGAREQMKHSGAQTVDIGPRLNSPAKELRRRITHSPHCGHAFLLLLDPPGNAKIDDHDPTRVPVYHQIRGLEIAIDNWLGPAVEILQNVRGLHSPIGYCFLVYFASRCITQSGGEITSSDKLHHQVETAQRLIAKIVVDSRKRRMVARGKQQ